MTTRSLRYLTGITLAVLLVVALAFSVLAQTGALSQKATEAAEITAAAQQDGHVRVIVMFDPPVPLGQLKSDATSVANAKAWVAAAQDGIIASHSATPPIRRQAKASTAGSLAFRSRLGLRST
jgi:hypothetical protein